MNVKQLTDELCWPDGHGEKRCRLGFTSLPVIKLFQPTLIKPGLPACLVSGLVRCSALSVGGRFLYLNDVEHWRNLYTYKHALELRIVTLPPSLLHLWTLSSILHSCHPNALSVITTVSWDTWLYSLVDRLERILTMVYVVQNYWAYFGLYP
jgi:hypothetical protein